MKELVRHMAASTGPRVAVAGFEKEVEVWDISTSVHVATFSTVLDFGGKLTKSLRASPGSLNGLRPFMVRNL
jgi:hypothetical protein